MYDRAHAPWTFLPFLRRVRKGRFDLVIDLQRHLKSGSTSRISGARDRFGFDAANTKEFNHRFSNHRIAPQPNLRLKLMQYQAFGDALGLAQSPIEFGLAATDDERARALATLADAPRPLLAVILGSSWPSRIYFPESTAAVIRRLARADGDSPALFPVLLGGPDETKLAGEVMRHLGDVPALNLAGRTSLRDLIAIFPECAVAFGPDSGPMHIAAALGCPVVSLWGATAADAPRRGALPNLQSAARSRVIPAIFVNAQSGANVCGEYPPKKSAGPSGARSRCVRRRMSWWAAGDGVELNRGGWNFVIPGYDARFSEELREGCSIPPSPQSTARWRLGCAARVTPRPGSNISITD